MWVIDGVRVWAKTHECSIPYLILLLPYSIAMHSLTLFGAFTNDPALQLLTSHLNGLSHTLEIEGKVYLTWETFQIKPM